MSAEVGSIADEAALLLDALAVRLAAVRRAAADTSAAPEGPAAREAPEDSADPDVTGGPCPQCGHDPSHTPACTACPLCRLLALLRGERPEAALRLADGALSVVQALRGLLPVAAQAADDQPADGQPADDQPADGSPGEPAGSGTSVAHGGQRPGLQRIPLS